MIQVSTHHVSVLQMVVGEGDDGLRTSVQQLLYAAVKLPPSGRAEEVQAEAPQGFLRQTLQQREDRTNGHGRTTQERLRRDAGIIDELKSLHNGS